MRWFFKFLRIKNAKDAQIVSNHPFHNAALHRTKLYNLNKPYCTQNGQNSIEFWPFWLQ